MNKQNNCASVDEPSDNATWVAGETAGCKFRDARLGKRLSNLLQVLGDGIGRTVPLACQDWANTKAAYRFFDNDRVSEHDILSGDFEATAQRFSAPDGQIIV